jgi:hypothetical protein
MAVIASTVYWGSGWSKLNCWTHEIHTSTGHTRYTRYWFWRATERRVEPTWISRALALPAPGSDPAGEAAWRTVHTLSPGTSHSPHYVFHSALADLRMFEQLLRFVRTDAATLRSVAQNTVWLWTQFDDDAQAGNYLSEITNAAIQKEKLTRTDVPELAEWLRKSHEALRPSDREGHPGRVIAAAIEAARSNHANGSENEQGPPTEQAERAD